MINIFVIGKKGLESVAQINPSLLGNINALIIAKDAGVINDYSAEIVAFAEANNIRWFFRSETEQQLLAQAKLNIAIGWRWLIPLDIPLVVFHDSILPKYRGFNPLVSALINGDSQIGVTALIGTDEFDKGDIIGQRIINIDHPIKIETAIDLLSNEYALLMNDVMSAFINNSMVGKPQNESDASFSLWRDDEDYKIDWDNSSAEIKRTIDAVGFPYKGACTEIDGILVRIFDAEIVPDVNIVNRTPGKVLFKHEDGYVIVCGTGLLKVGQFFDDKGAPVNTTKFRIRFK